MRKYGKRKKKSEAPKPKQNKGTPPTVFEELTGYMKAIGAGATDRPDGDPYLPDNLNALTDDELNDLNLMFGKHLEHLVGVKQATFSGKTQAKKNLLKAKRAALMTNAELKPKDVREAAVNGDFEVAQCSKDLDILEGRWKITMWEIERIETDKSVVKDAIRLRVSSRYHQRGQSYSHYPRADEAREKRRRSLPKPSKVKDTRWRADEDG